LRFILNCNPEQVTPAGKKVAIIGAGVAGLGAAGYLYCKGYHIDAYDSMPEAGGLLLFGIPNERMPKKGVLEGINQLKRYGVEFYLNKAVQDELLEEIIESHDATLIATGTWKARQLNVPGVDLQGVMLALDFLVANSLHDLDFSSSGVALDGRIGIIGGGYTAVDAALESLKWSKDVFIFYRRTISESEARCELKALKQKGVTIYESTLPKSIYGTKKVQGIELWDVKFNGSEVNYVPGSARNFPLDYVLIAIGEDRTPPYRGGLNGISTVDGKPIVNDRMMTTRKSVFAAGDLVNGPTYIGNALSSGLKAAKYIDEFLH